MLKAIATHFLCICLGFVFGLIFTFLDPLDLDGKEKQKSRSKANLSAKKETVPHKPSREKVVSKPTISNQSEPISKLDVSTAKKLPAKSKESPKENEKLSELKTEPMRKQDTRTVQQLQKKETQESLKENQKQERACQAQRAEQKAKQKEEQVEPYAKREVPVSTTKMLKFKRQSQIKEIKLEINLGMKEIFTTVEKEMKLDVGTRVTNLVCRGKRLKEGFLDSILDGSTVMVMVKKSKSTLTEPPTTKPPTTKSSKTKDEGLDFLDSVLDGLKEPPKLAVKQNQSLATREKTKGFGSKNKPRSKISISRGKKIQYQLNKDIIEMQKVWCRRSNGLSTVYHQGFQLAQGKHSTNAGVR